ncbi:DUF2523 family protein [Oleiagrimonas soli]|uniref:DUF2523 domain-containing protein n=1 Tax=Oleiagrimonas soli TaxID=1543381 RepID=A0A841KDN3_9GAMM|nr:DUF2523 family protein [Oleiagrimonas soli]MBB6183286.1 hypothetical protein [Oleiagrimonas soli]
MLGLIKRFLPALIALLGKMMSTKLGRWIAGALVWLGVGFATQTAFHYALTDWVADGWAGIPADLAAWLSYLNVDAAVSLILSGYVAGWAVKNGSRAVHLAARASTS